MFTVSLKIAYPIIIAGLFVTVAFMAYNYESLNAGFYFIFASLVVYTFLFGFATGQNFAKPIRNLLAKAQNLSEGDLKSRVYLNNKDELGELAHVFNKIAENLEESKSDTSRMENSVDIKVRARTQALEETINALEQKVSNRTMEIQKLAADLEKLQQLQQSQPIVETTDSVSKKKTKE